MPYDVTIREIPEGKSITQRIEELKEIKELIEPFAYKDIEVHLVKVKGGDNNGSLKKMFKRFDTLLKEVSEFNDATTVIYFIKNLLESVPDESWSDLDDMIEQQLSYQHPLKMATTMRQHALGEANKKVVDKLKELKEVFKESGKIGE